MALAMRALGGLGLRCSEVLSLMLVIRAHCAAKRVESPAIALSLLYRPAGGIAPSCGKYGTLELDMVCSSVRLASVQKDITDTPRIHRTGRRNTNDTL